MGCIHHPSHHFQLHHQVVPHSSSGAKKRSKSSLIDQESVSGIFLVRLRTGNELLFLFFWLVPDPPQNHQTDSPRNGYVSTLFNVYVGVSKNRGTSKMDGLQWKTPIKMDDLGGYHYFWKHPCSNNKPTELLHSLTHSNPGLLESAPASPSLPPVWTPV